MPEGKTDLAQEIALRKQLFQTRRLEFYQKYQDKGIDLTKLDQYSDIFSNGIQEGSVKVEPHKDGTASVFIDTVISGEKETKELAIDNIDEAAFFVGLQMKFNPPEKK